MLSTTDLQDTTQRVLDLMQELLDAHCDTVCLSETPASDLEWMAHLEYLKDLRRVGQRALAELAAA